MWLRPVGSQEWIFGDGSGQLVQQKSNEHELSARDVQDDRSASESVTQAVPLDRRPPSTSKYGIAAAVEFFE